MIEQCAKRTEPHLHFFHKHHQEGGTMLIVDEDRILPFVVAIDAIRADSPCVVGLTKKPPFFRWRLRAEDVERPCVIIWLWCVGITQTDREVERRKQAASRKAEKDPGSIRIARG